MRKAVYLLVLIVMLACERNVSIDLPQEPPRLVVNAFVTPDSLVQVQVSRSMSVLERPRLTGITEAQVKLYQDGQQIATLRQDSLLKYVYLSEGKPIEAGKEYTIAVSAPSYEPVTGHTFVPPAVRIKQITVSEGAGTNLDGNFYNTLHIELDDPAGEENYYAVQVKALEYLLIENKQTGKKDTLIREISRNLFPEPTLSGLRAEKQMLFNDRQYDGRAASLLTYFYPFSQQSSKRQEYAIYLLSVDKIYYQYYQRLPDHLTNQSFEIIGGETVPMPGNISNGYGIFAGYSFNRVLYK